MGQLGKIHEINTVAYVEAARYALCSLGGYTQAEFEVLSECPHVSDAADIRRGVSEGAQGIRSV